MDDVTSPADRALLESAARAIGSVLTWEGDSPPYPRASPSDSPHWNPFWNPLTDDGDALRVAIYLKLEIRPGTWSITVSGNGAWEEVSRRSYTDGYATRLAIVRAAAAMAPRE